MAVLAKRTRTEWAMENELSSHMQRWLFQVRDKACYRNSLRKYVLMLQFPRLSTLHHSKATNSLNKTPNNTQHNQNIFSFFFPPLIYLLNWQASQNMWLGQDKKNCNDNTTKRSAKKIETLSTTNLPPSIPLYFKEKKTQQNSKCCSNSYGR